MVEFLQIIKLMNLEIESGEKTVLTVANWIQLNLEDDKITKWLRIMKKIL